MLEENVTWKKGVRGRGRGREGLRVFGRVLSLPDLIGGSLGRVVMRLIRALMKSMVRFGVGYRMIRSERTMINAISHRQSVIRLFWRVLPFHWEKGDFFFLSPSFYQYLRRDEHFWDDGISGCYDSMDRLWSMSIRRTIFWCNFSTFIIIIIIAFANCRNVERDVNFFGRKVMGNNGKIISNGFSRESLWRRLVD